MSLKPKLPEKPDPGLATPIAWGVLAEPEEPVAMLRVEIADGEFSYPYHVIARLQWLPGSVERLLVYAGSDRVIIKGTGLPAVRDALETGRLRVLRRPKGRYAKISSGVLVTSVGVEER